MVPIIKYLALWKALNRTAADCSISCCMDFTERIRGKLQPKKICDQASPGVKTGEHFVSALGCCVISAMR